VGESVSFTTSFFGLLKNYFFLRQEMSDLQLHGCGGPQVGRKLTEVHLEDWKLINGPSKSKARATTTLSLSMVGVVVSCLVFLPVWVRSCMHLNSYGWRLFLMPPATCMDLVKNKVLVDRQIFQILSTCSDGEAE